MMSELSGVHPLAYPWQQELDSVVKAADRRKDETTKVASPDAIISELTLGFWTNLLEKRPANEELWRQHLRQVFPGSPGTRESVHKAVASVRILRSRCAHQDSLLDFDPSIELKKLLSLVEWIDPEARVWLEGIETVSDVARSRPVDPDRNVVVVGASREDIDMYKRHSAFVCPSERSIAQVSRLGFYLEKRIEPFFPRIEDRIVPTRWNKEEAKRLRDAGSDADQWLGRVMSYGLTHGWAAGEQVQVFHLTEEKSDTTVRRKDPIPHKKSGRGSAFVKRPRYFAQAALVAADDTDHLG